MVVSYQLVLGASAKRLSDVYGGPAGVPDERTNIPYRQLMLQSTGASATIGSTSAVTTTTGTVIPTTLAGGLVLGPFSTGPVKLSDLWAVGAGATLNILGVPF